MESCAAGHGARSSHLVLWLFPLSILNFMGPPWNDARSVHYFVSACMLNFMGPRGTTCMLNFMGPRGTTQGPFTTLCLRVCLTSWVPPGTTQGPFTTLCVRICLTSWVPPGTTQGPFTTLCLYVCLTSWVLLERRKVRSLLCVCVCIS
jgi:hypothetical protein